MALSSFVQRTGRPKPSGPSKQLPLAALSGGDALVLAAELRKRMISEQEDAYWHARFGKEPYYVAGRGYDQYKPAYELGWTGALQHPYAGFTDFDQVLERQWGQECATSLLPWREVRPAVKGAWMHASVQMLKIQRSPSVSVYGRDLEKMLRPLHTECQALASEFEDMRAALSDDFVQQVMERHIHLLQRCAQGLKPWCGIEVGAQEGPSLWSLRWHARWRQWKSSFSPWMPEQVLATCEHKERRLLTNYQRVLCQSLPAEVKDILGPQAKALQLHLGKLGWLRRNWVL